ncbi:hypothetical protein IMZ48_22660, partial [Candidatus Bathyarchaeota archaeon]|nr:hypothetical protein [Candidatus Bathyarchaeota archaeon]
MDVDSSSVEASDDSTSPGEAASDVPDEDKVSRLSFHLRTHPAHTSHPCTSVHN